MKDFLSAFYAIVDDQTKATFTAGATAIFLCQTGTEHHEATDPFRVFIGGVLQAHHMFFWNNQDRKSTRLNSSHVAISYAVFCLKKKINYHYPTLHEIESLAQRVSGFDIKEHRLELYGKCKACKAEAQKQATD